MTWAFLAVLVLAMFRPPPSDRWWAWVAWFLVCLALIVAASVVSVMA